MPGGGRLRRFSARTAIVVWHEIARQPHGGLEPKKGGLGAQGALALLRWMDDLDKHATVRPGFIAPKTVTYHAYWNKGNTGDVDPGRDDAEFEEIWNPFTPLDNRAKLYRAKFRFGPQMSVPMTIEPDVNFGMAPYGLVTLEVLRVCFEWVRWFVDRFREITPGFRAAHDAPPAPEGAANGGSPSSSEP